MTKGDIAKQILTFSLPLFLGNIFQQFYNMADTWVLGNFASNEAFSAVGTLGSVTNLLIGLFWGLSSGASVVISRFFGARKYEDVNKASHTLILSTLILGIIFTLLFLPMIPMFLKFIKMPSEAYNDAYTYLKIYIIGLTGLVIYNASSSILRAIGDSVKPFLFLVLSTVINVVLDCILVIKFNMGSMGVAYATVIAEALSALCSLIVLFKTDSPVKLSFKKMRIDFDIMESIIRIGIPTGLQMFLVAFSNIFVQSYINYFGTDCMAGWAAYSKLDSLLLLPIQSIALAVMTFTGQNLGADNLKRAKEGVKKALIINISITLILLIPLNLFTEQLVSFFNSKEEVIYYGSTFIRYISPFYLSPAIHNVLTKAVNGSGESRVTMILSIFSFIIVRQIYLYIIANYLGNSFILIGLGYPFGWLSLTTLSIIYYLKYSVFRN